MYIIYEVNKLINIGKQPQFYNALLSIYELDSMSAFWDFFQGESRLMTLLIAHGQKECNPSLLASELHVTKGRVTAILNGLERKGLVELQRSSADKRRITVSLTAKGTEQATAKIEGVVAYIDKWALALGQDKVDELTDILDRTSAILKEMM